MHAVFEPYLLRRTFESCSAFVCCLSANSVFGSTERRRRFWNCYATQFRDAEADLRKLLGIWVVVSIRSLAEADLRKLLCTHALFRHSIILLVRLPCVSAVSRLNSRPLPHRSPPVLVGWISIHLRCRATLMLLIWCRWCFAALLFGFFYLSSTVCMWVAWKLTLQSSHNTQVWKLISNMVLSSHMQFTWEKQSEQVMNELIHL